MSEDAKPNRYSKWKSASAERSGTAVAIGLEMVVDVDGTLRQGPKGQESLGTLVHCTLHVKLSLHFMQSAEHRVRFF